MDWDHPDRVALEQEINKIEDWCIGKGYIKRKTTWEKGDGKKKNYWHCRSYSCMGRVLNMNTHTHCRNCGKERYAKNKGYA